MLTLPETKMILEKATFIEILLENNTDGLEFILYHISFVQKVMDTDLH